MKDAWKPKHQTRANRQERLAPKNLVESISMLTPLIVSLTAIFTLAFSVYQYAMTSRINAEAKKMELAKPLLEKRYHLYLEVIGITSKLATTNNQQEYEDLSARFRQLYWGEMGLVEGAKVEEAMVGFKEALDARSDLKDRDDLDGRQRGQSLTTLSYVLAKTLGAEIKQSWSQPL